MAGAAGTNVDAQGFIFDPALPDVIQHWKEVGAQAVMTDRMRHVVGGYRTVKIPTASVLTLNATPIQIVPAAGPGTLIVPEMMVASLVFGTAAYSTNAAGATLFWGANGAGTSSLFTLSQAFLQSASGTNTQIVYQGSAATCLPATTDFNAPLTLIAASSNPTTGDSDLYVRVYYHVVTLPFTTNMSP